MASREDATVRTALLDQLAYLVDEMEALEAVIHRVPDPLQEARPPTGEGRSIKELFGMLAEGDEKVFLPWVRQVEAGGDPAVAAPDEAPPAAESVWQRRSIDEIIEHVRRVRNRLVDALRALPPDRWRRTGRVDGERIDVYTLARRIAHRDAALLRIVGYRLHESHLTDRPQDLPK